MVGNGFSIKKVKTLITTATISNLNEVRFFKDCNILGQMN